MSVLTFLDIVAYEYNKNVYEECFQSQFKLGTQKNLKTKCLMFNV